MISGIGSGYSSYYSSASAIKGTATTASGNSVSGGEDGNPLKKLFSKLDSDGDGAISKSELTTAASAASDTQTATDESGDIDVDKLLGMLDQDGDGSVGESEFASAFAPPPGAPGAPQGQRGTEESSDSSVAGLGGSARPPMPPPPPQGTSGQGDTEAEASTGTASSPYAQRVQAVLRQYQSIGSNGTSSATGSTLNVAA
ncbi:EF-hand domain-containing protein [Pseudomonas benzopyrenica]|uniref:EF-hand domain-containing protein n=1 Tax=Pseudomonas benzopyrenica TaxID=2993566 RepID=A0ABZ2FVA1_9PSED|nr:EF-hand domain-containing protein [Pseudomonas psychrotolerans]UUW73037.1 EF-hand domain-containing protein [Pseudomonas psychrotolerans]